VHYVDTHKKQLAIDSAVSVGIAAVIVVAPEVAPAALLAVTARVGAARVLAAAAAKGAQEGEDRLGATAPKDVTNAARAIGALLRVSEVRSLPQPSLIAINRLLRNLGQKVLKGSR
jgi:hypothetical protein